MSQIGVYRKVLWPIAVVTCAVVLTLCLTLGYLSGKENWLREWLRVPLIPLLSLILGIFIYGVSRIHKALRTYEAEEQECRAVSKAISMYSTPGEIAAQLTRVDKGNTTIGKRVGQALESSDLDTASAVMQLPQPMDVEEDKTFGGLQFLRSALVLIGLLSTVVFFALAFSATKGDGLKNLTPLISDLQRALTMTMAGIATSVVLGGMSTRLFDIQQDLKLRVDELTALMLPRLLPHYEKGTKEEPGPALLLEKLQDFFREVEGWKSEIGTDVERLAAVLVEHHKVLSNLPAVVLPKSFSSLNTSLSQVTTTMAQMSKTTERALQALTESRDLDLNNVVGLLSEIRTDSERIKGSQRTLLEEVLPKQVAALTQLNKLGSALEKVGDGLRRNTEAQVELTRTNNLIQRELARLSQPMDEQLVEKMQDVVDAIHSLRNETVRMNEAQQKSSTYRAPAAPPPPARYEPPGPKPTPPPPRTTSTPPAAESAKPPAPAPVAYTESTYEGRESRSVVERVRDWFSNLFQTRED